MSVIRSEIKTATCCSDIQCCTQGSPPPHPPATHTARNPRYGKTGSASVFALLCLPFSLRIRTVQQFSIKQTLLPYTIFKITRPLGPILFSLRNMGGTHNNNGGFENTSSRRLHVNSLLVVLSTPSPLPTNKPILPNPPRGRAIISKCYPGSMSCLYLPRMYHAR